MDQDLNNRQNELFFKLLANPADSGHTYAGNLQSLVNDFPQSGLLQAMLAHAEGGQAINHAAAYFDPKALYMLVNSADSLSLVSDAQIIHPATASTPEEIPTTDIIGTEHRFSTNEEPAAEQETTRPVTVVAEDERLEVESIDHIVEEQKAPGEIEEPVYEEIEPVTEAHIHVSPVEQPAEEEVSEFVFDETEPLVAPSAREDSEDHPIIINAENESFFEDELVTEAGGVEEAEVEEETVQEIPAEEAEQKEETITHHTEPEKEIEDDVFDEIVGIEDINFARVFMPEPGIETISDIAEEEHNTQLENQVETEPKERALNLDDEAEKLIVGNIAATDYFVFDRAISEGKQSEAIESVPLSEPAPEHKEVSKYHDEKMPYTFMWWLDKTRKEHAGIYQPFKLDTSQVIHQSGAQELQQQYYENIFHLNSVEELDRSTSASTIEFDMKNKEDTIIKKFIVEEPHINPPSSDKLDNENKAKKSAEDQDEMVTETLARIYSDQMLYHKAISTYKKLMLKFPEKSRYFADQIEQLERKTN